MKEKKVRKRKKQRLTREQYFDYSMFAVLIFLICFGLVMLYSTSSYSALVKTGDSMHYFKRQLLFCVLGLIGVYVVSKIDYHIYIKWAKPLFFLSLFLMLLVQTPLGKEVNGAKRWIQLPFEQQFQPAEVTKIAVILFIPVVILQMGKEIKTLAGIGKVLVWGAVAASCVFFFTENLSTAIIVMGITCLMIFVVHPKTAPFVAVATAGLGIILVGVQILVRMVGESAGGSGNFRFDRILAWLNPEADASGNSFQTLQGLYAIGSGGFFGKGLGNSAQKMIIPEVQNDMILTVICEELGVFGAIIVLILFGMLLYRMLFIAQNAPDVYGSLIVTGIFAHIALQVIFNVAVVTNLLPTTGITLPFISYGGTAILFLAIEMGIALGVSRRIIIEE